MVNDEGWPTHDDINPRTAPGSGARGGDPVRIEDPITRESYVILKAAVYEKLREQVEVEKVDPSFYEYGEVSPRG